MRLAFLLAAATAFAASVPVAAQPDDGFDDRGVDRHDRTPDWNYRRGENEGKGAYYDGGRYGPRGLLTKKAALDPWLAGTDLAQIAPAKANRRFRKIADRDRDARLTDAEIFDALKRVAVR